METRLSMEVLEALGKPFPVEAVSWKPGATNKEKTKAMALAYVDPRHYMDRLNEVLGGEWSDSYEVQNDGQIVVCHLTIMGVTRCDVGEDDSPGGDEDRGPKNKATTSAAQAFKRACVKFGLGAYLYRLPRIWATYDAARRQFSEEGLAVLSKALGSPAPKAAKANGNGDQPTPAAPRPNGNGASGDQPAPTPVSVKANGNGVNGNPGPTQFWQAVRELGVDRAKAQTIANGLGTWAEKVAALRD